MKKETLIQKSTLVLDIFGKLEGLSCMTSFKLQSPRPNITLLSYGLISGPI